MFVVEHNEFRNLLLVLFYPADEAQTDILYLVICYLKLKTSIEQTDKTNEVFVVFLMLETLPQQNRAYVQGPKRPHLRRALVSVGRDVWHTRAIR